MCANQKDQNMLIKKRQAQHEAIQKIISFSDKKKESEMVTLIAKKLFETLSKSLENLMKIQNDEGKFALDEKTTNGMCLINQLTHFFLRS